jgi:hypothetical protein
MQLGGRELGLDVLDEVFGAGDFLVDGLQLLIFRWHETLLVPVFYIIQHSSLL